MNELSLFTGAGGGLLASVLLGWRTVCAVEHNPYRQEVIRARQRDGHLEAFEIFDDVRTFDGRPWGGRVDVVSGGFPCQPFSAAGKRRGADDSRNMWPDTARIIGEVRPRYAFLENVPALLAHRYFGRILGDLAESGYNAVWDCIGACHVGAPHQRERIWILAHPGKNGHPLIYGEQAAQELTSRCALTRSANPGWNPPSQVARVADGMADDVDRVEALGDGQVPLVAALAFRRLAKIVEDMKEETT